MARMANAISRMAKMAKKKRKIKIKKRIKRKIRKRIRRMKKNILYECVCLIEHTHIGRMASDPGTM